MVKEDLAGEEHAIEVYSKQLKMIGSADVVTHRLIEDILLDENKHAEQWKTVLGK